MPSGPTGSSWKICGIAIPNGTRDFILLVAGFEEPRRALAPADAHRDHAVARLAPQHLVGDGADHARACHAEGMADGDRPAVGIELLHRDAKRVAAVHDLGGE